MPKLRVVIAEDHYLVREGTRRALEDSGEVEVVAAVASADELEAAVDRLSPDVVVTDIRMPPSHHRGHRRRAPHPGAPPRHGRRGAVAVRGGDLRARAAP